MKNIDVIFKEISGNIHLSMKIKTLFQSYNSMSAKVGLSTSSVVF